MRRSTHSSNLARWPWWVASRNPKNIGNRILNAILSAGFTGSVYPVNPKADSVAKLKAYPSLGALPVSPDLAVVTVR